MTFSEENIKNLAPDDASIKAGQQLATRSKWESANQHELALWGECKGSGKNPYFTQVDLTNVAFKCSCPSRKFPCKHGLGLLFLYTNDKTYFNQQKSLHEKVEEWLGKRGEKAESKKEKENKPVDKEAQEKRFQQREKKVQEGIVELKTWMQDIIRVGIQNIPQNQYSFSRSMKAKMIDSQAPGLARHLDGLAEMDMYAPNWEHDFLNKFSKLYTLATAYQQVETLDESWQMELKNRIGYTVNKADFNPETLLKESLLTLHQTKEVLDRNLVNEKTWFFAPNSKRFYFVLQFYPISQSAQAQMFMVGNRIDAAFFIYPGLGQQRILMDHYAASQIQNALEFPNSLIPEYHQHFANALAHNPFLEEFPVLLKSYRLINSNQEWFVVDQNQNAWKIALEKMKILKIWALSLEEPLDWFGVYQDAVFKPLAFVYKQKYHTL